MKKTKKHILCGAERHTDPATHRPPATPEEKKDRARLIKRCYLTDMRDSLQRTLAALYYFANKDTDSLLNPLGQWHCFPTVKKIAERAELSASTIYEHLPLLEEMGYINYQNRYRQCRRTDQYRQTSNIYYLVDNKVDTAYYIALKRLKAMRGVVSKAISAGKNGVRNATPKALSFGKKQEPIDPPFFASKNQTGHAQWRYDEANQETDRLLREAKANKSADPQSHIQKLKALLGLNSHKEALCP